MGRLIYIQRRLLSAIRSPTKIIRNSLDAKALISNFDCFLFDCDGILSIIGILLRVILFSGVIWRGNEMICGVQQTLFKLREMNKKVCYFTVNSLSAIKCLYVNVVYIEQFNKIQRRLLYKNEQIGSPS